MWIGRLQGKLSSLCHIHVLRERKRNKWMNMKTFQKLTGWKEIVATGKQALQRWKRQDVDVAQPRKSPKEKWC
ncbi:hypothetical protein ACOMHN_016172 [Nucella lapillus]